MKNKYWNGYIYEHIYLAIKMMGRPLYKNEVVHHLDGNKQNNRISNLIVLYKNQHSKLHKWIEKGAPYSKEYGEQRMNSGKSKTRCVICDITLQNAQKQCCSETCYAKWHSRNIPDKETLSKLLENNNKSAIGRKYRVSCNAVRKWMKKYNML